MDNIWILNPDAYSSISNESRKYILHPKIVELINQKDGVKILDYGCGDGSLIQLLKSSCEISLFDISNVVLARAKNNLKKYKPTIYYDRATIPEAYFDFVVFSLVVMTIPTKKDIKEALTKIQSSINQKGVAIIAITHPCFRQEIFSTFQTAYSKDKKFNYFKESEKFEVLLRDSETNQSTTFNDYHWTLGTILNLISESGLTLKRFIELPDKAENNKYFNPSFSPYIVIECSKK